MKKRLTPYQERLLNEFRLRIPITKTGTYNDMDPTHFENGVLIHKDCLKLCYSDCTWGVTYEILYSTNSGFKKLFEVYVDNDDKTYEHSTENTHSFWQMIYGLNKIIDPIFSKTEEGIRQEMMREEHPLEGICPGGYM